MLEHSLLPLPPEFWLLTGLHLYSKNILQISSEALEESGLLGDGHFVSSYRKEPVMGFGWTGPGCPLPKRQNS